MLKRTIAIFFVIILSFSFSVSANSKTLTRGEFSHMLADVLQERKIVTQAKSISFNDTSKDNMYFNDISYLSSLGIISGDGNGQFRANDKILWQEAAAMLARVFFINDDILNNFGTYPNGYINATKEKLLPDIELNADSYIIAQTAEVFLEKVKNNIKHYSIAQPLGGSEYNGKIYVDYYPKPWQGYDRRPVAGTNGYFKILPCRVLYSYDKENWTLAYEDTDKGRMYYGLPEEYVSCEYFWPENAFIAKTKQGAEYISYDYINWTPYKSKGVEQLPEMPPLPEKNIFGIENVILYVEDENLFFTWIPYEENYHFSNIYKTDFYIAKHNVLWVSQDGKEWIALTVPEDALYFKTFSARRDSGGIVADCALEFTPEEQTYLDNEETFAAEAGLDYDKPATKTKRYFMRYDDIKKLFEKSN